MKLTSAGYERVGKAFITIGQGMILATLASMLFSEKTFAVLPGLLGVAVGGMLLYVGIWYIEGGRTNEEKRIEGGIEMENFLIVGAILAALGLASIAVDKYFEKKRKAQK